MEITTINYSRTLNLGDYNSEKVEMTASLETYDDPNESLKQLKHVVHFAMGLTKNKPKYVKLEEIAEVVEGGNLKKTDGTIVKVDETTEVIPEKPKKKVAKKKVVKKVAKKEEVELPPVIITLEEVKAEFKNLAKTKGVPVAKEVLKDFGVTKTDELKSEDYEKAMKAVAKCLK